MRRCNGKPLAGASKVRAREVPRPQRADGDWRDRPPGAALVSAPLQKDERPGVLPGFYRVEITMPGPPFRRNTTRRPSSAPKFAATAPRCAPFDLSFRCASERRPRPSTTPPRLPRW